MLKGTKRVIKRSSGSNGLYFDAETQKSIEAFQQETEQDVRHTIYVSKIMPAFDKLVESLIFIYGFAGPGEPIEHLKSDCVTFLYESMHKFDPKRGSKAFSYFNVVARNWLVIYSKNRQKKTNRFVSLEDLREPKTADAQQFHATQVCESPEDMMIERNRREDILVVLKKIRSHLSHDYELACLDAIVTVFSQVDDLDFLNKRAIFVYVRNISNLNQKQLGSAMTVIRRHYRTLVKSGEFL